MGAKLCEDLSMSPRPRPPHGELIEAAREQAGLSMREAARRAGVSDAWWRYVVNGWQGDTPVAGTAETVAGFARVVGVTPEELESRGQRPDAAEILRSAPRVTDAPRPRLAAVPDSPPLPDDPSDEQVEAFIIAQEPFSRRDLLWRTWRFEAAARSERVKAIRALTDPVDLEEDQEGRHREPGA